MSRDKQIEEMAKVLCCDYDDCAQCICKSTERDGDGCCTKLDCEKLYNAGYRKASDVAREIFEEIERKLTFIRDADTDIILGIVTIKDISRLKKKYESEGAE